MSPPSPRLFAVFTSLNLLLASGIWWWDRRRGGVQHARRARRGDADDAGTLVGAWYGRSDLNRPCDGDGINAAWCQTVRAHDPGHTLLMRSIVRAAQVQAGQRPLDINDVWRERMTFEDALRVMSLPLVQTLIHALCDQVRATPTADPFQDRVLHALAPVPAVQTALRVVWDHYAAFAVWEPLEPPVPMHVGDPRWN